MPNAQWREVTKDRVYALYVHDRHRIAIVQKLDTNRWIVTMPDSPTSRHEAKTQDEAFKAGRKLATAWLRSAIKQLSEESSTTRLLTPEENKAEIRQRQRGYVGM